MPPCVEPCRPRCVPVDEGPPGSDGRGGNRPNRRCQLVGSRPLPGLEVIAEAAAGVHPLTLAGFMTRSDVDLEVDGEPVSPIEWLVAGGDPAAVADLAAGLHVPA